MRAARKSVGTEVFCRLERNLGIAGGPRGYFVLAKKLTGPGACSVLGSAPPMRPSIAALGLTLTACYSSGEGITPPLDRIYFPVGLTTDCDNRARDASDCRDCDVQAGASGRCESKYLYVASSDFDLQYNAGSIQVLDLSKVREKLPRECTSDDQCSVNSPECDPQSHFCVQHSTGSPKNPCGELGLQSAADQSLYPGPCKPVGLTKSILTSSVEIGAFATDIFLTSDLDRTRKRLLVPVRGESSLHWIDLREDGKLDCGQTKASNRCDQKHRVGTDPSKNTRNVKMPPEPYAIAASDEGDAIVLTHQSSGTLSIFRQDPKYREGDKDSGWNAGPFLEYIHPLTAWQAVAVAAVPEPAFVRRKRKAWFDSGQTGPDPYPPGFLVAYANAPQVDLVRYYWDIESSPMRTFAQQARTAYITANSGGTVSRGVTFDDTERRQCDEQCGDGDDDCFRGCADQAIGVYVSSRSPASLVVGSTAPWALETPSRDLPRFQDVVPTPIGPARVYVGKVLVACGGADDSAGTDRRGCGDGRLETRVFLVCFDQRRIVIYDPKRGRIEDIVKTGRGPHAMAFDFYEGTGPDDPSRALAYVGHFTDSYVGVVELDRRKLHSYASVILSLATPVAPRASK